MSWIVSSIGDFFQRRRRAFAVTGGVVGGAYLVGKYALGKLHDTQQRMVAERRDKENLRRRFAQNQEDCTFTALALLPALADQLFAALNVEEITLALQRKKSRPAPPAPQREAAEGHGSVTQPTTEGDQPSASHAADGGVKQKPPQQSDLTDSTQTPKTPATATTAEPSTDPAEAQDGSEESPKEESLLDASSNNQAQSTCNEQPTSDKPPTPEQTSANPTDGTSAPSTELSETVAAQETVPVTGSSGNTTEPTPGEAQEAEQPTHQPFTTTKSPATPPDATASSEPSVDKDGAERQGASSSTSVPNEEAGPNGHGEHKPEPQPHPPPSESSEAVAKIEEDKVKERQHTLTLWNELKVVSLSRAVTGVYAIALLTLQTHIMLNLIGRYSYLASVVALGQKLPTDGEGVDDDDLQAASDAAQRSIDPSEAGPQAGIDPRTERLYLTFSWWLLHRGWPRLVSRVRTAVESTFGQLSIMNPMSWHEFDRLLRSVRRKVEYDVLPPLEQEAYAAAAGGSSLFGQSAYGEDLQSSALSEVSGTTRGSRRLLAKRRTFLDILFPTTEEEDEEVLIHGAGYTTAEAKRAIEQDGTLWSLLNESKDLVESPDFRLVQRMSLDGAFNVLRSEMRSSFQLPPLTPEGTEPSLPLLDAHRFQELSTEEESMFFTSGAGRRVKLAQLFPAMARLSKLAFSASPNEYVEAVESVKELRAFSAVIYSSWPKDMP